MGAEKLRPTQQIPFLLETLDFSPIKFEIHFNILFVSSTSKRMLLLQSKAWTLGAAAREHQNKCVRAISFSSEGVSQSLAHQETIHLRKLNQNDG